MGHVEEGVGTAGAGPRRPAACGVEWLSRWGGPVFPARVRALPPPRPCLILVPLRPRDSGEQCRQGGGVGGSARGVLFETCEDHRVELGGHLALRVTRWRIGRFVAMALDGL